MSIFPTKILLATDGSAEGQLATRTAADLAQRTDSELQWSPWELVCRSLPPPPLPTSKMWYGRTDARPRRVLEQQVKRYRGVGGCR